MQQNEDYVLRVLSDVGLVSRQQIDSARSRLNGEPGVIDVLVNDGIVSDADVSRTLAALGQMDWIDISTMVIPPQVINQIRAEDARRFSHLRAAKSYFTFKSIPPSTDGTSNSGMLSITRSGGTYTVNYIRDPFGNSYGYSTLSANYLDWQNYDACISGGGSCQPPSCPRRSSSGYNPTFGLWSTSGLTANPGNPDTITPQWIKNW